MTSKELYIYFVFEIYSKTCIENLIAKRDSKVEHLEVNKKIKVSGMHFLKAKIHVSAVGKIQKNCILPCLTSVYCISLVLAHFQQLSIIMSG